ncbi:MAG: DUF5063 domain-containing protein [Prevotella sp.]|nr:DUF5063 domain-containing protein [Bacteroides sp.]MCM1366173.1 DUF5063 domain-containing protein [Prevotella sp.]MCM1436762.1 DUF5063 domain-containing protein [Prevotella sp.]
MTENISNRANLLNIVAVATQYCTTVQNTDQIEKEEFITSLLDLLPHLYWLFSITPATATDETYFLADYVDEYSYNQVRNNIAALLSEDDTYLETIEEDMKYSDSPIGASISEGLADIFQDLFNFVAEVKESEALQLEAAFDACKENFQLYWSATLCSVLRPLNHLRYNK